MSRVNKLRDDLAKINFVYSTEDFFATLRCEICGWEKKVPCGTLTSPVRYSLYVHSQTHGKVKPKEVKNA